MNRILAIMTALAFFCVLPACDDIYSQPQPVKVQKPKPEERTDKFEKVLHKRDYREIYQLIVGIRDNVNERLAQLRPLKGKDNNKFVELRGQFDFKSESWVILLNTRDEWLLKQGVMSEFPPGHPAPPLWRATRLMLKKLDNAHGYLFLGRPEDPAIDADLDRELGKAAAALENYKDEPPVDESIPIQKPGGLQ